MGGRSAFVWQGFDHEWLRTVLGFSLPHRISRLHTYIDDESHAGEGAAWRGTANFRFGQAAGVDGNFMRPRGFYSAFHAPGVFVKRGSVALAWTDDSDGGGFPQARSLIHHEIAIDTDCLELGMGRFDSCAVVLRGIALDSRCDPAKQPANHRSNSHGMWPYRMRFQLGSPTRRGALLACPLTVEVCRAWTPNRGGLPPFEDKPFNARLDFACDVRYTVVAGNAADFAVSYPPPVKTSSRGHGSLPATQHVAAIGSPGYRLATLGMTGWGFEFVRTGTRDKANHLGRYIGALRFRVADHAYDGETGVMAARTTGHVWLPRTVHDTTVNYELSSALLQFKAADDRTVVMASREAVGQLCANSDGAPWFSTWQRCGDPRFGPPKTHDTVAIAAPNG